jgi:arylsulfatase A-like enzyme
MATSRPNILWIFGDQHRAQALSGLGNPDLSTPVIDRMIGASRTGISGSPLCSPFRGSLLTGYYPHRCVPGHDYGLPEGSKTIADYFREAGYRTAYFGKWHVDGAERRVAGSSPALQHVVRDRRGGFDTWIAYELNNSQYDCWVHGHDDSDSEIAGYKLPGYETDSLTDLLLQHLQRQPPEQPFFAALSVQPPHNPYVAPPEYAARHTPETVQLRPNVPPIEEIQKRTRQDLASYYAMIENLDWNVGRVFDALRSTSLAENTLVIYFSDHGDMHGSQGRIWKSAPWEEAIRVPFLVADGHGNALQKFRDRTPDLINHVDILPTTLGLCGIDAPSQIQGADYSGYFRPDRAVPEIDSAYLQIVEPGRKWGYATDRERPWRGVVTRDGWKYAILEGQPWVMYNLNDDPYETVNLALNGDYHEQRSRLQGLLADWIERTGDEFKLPDISWWSME